MQPPAASPTIETGVVGGRLVWPGDADRGSARASVRVVGTAVSAVVGSSGEFVLANVPAGPLELHFTGQGLAAGITAGEIAGGETVTLIVYAGPTALRLDSIARVRGDAATIEGTIETSGETLPADTIIIAGRSVQLPPGRGAGLRPGMRVRVTGTVRAAGILARDLVIL